jgi:hypothetical protein
MNNGDVDRWDHVNMNGMKKLIKYLDINLNEAKSPSSNSIPQYFFDDIEITEDIMNIIELVETDQITDLYLQSIPQIQHLTVAFKRIIITHEPVVPYSFYDHFLSPVANYEKLVTSINKANHYFLDFVMNFLSKLVLNPNLLVDGKYIAKTVGMYLLRPENVTLYNGSSVDEVNHRQEIFLRILDRYCQTQKDHQKERSLSGENSPSPTHTPGGGRSSPVPESPAPTGSIQDRSVKVVFSNPSKRPTQEYLNEFFTQYGSIINVSSVFNVFIFIIIYFGPY